MIRALFISFFFFFVCVASQAQEICDNGIDDDGDNLIDLNDDDCQCTAYIQSSLIPNPSFEEMVCCPTQNAMLNCATGWIQASNPTTDYIHTCGNYLGNTNIPAFAPLPFPDGEGAVGFRDGQFNVGPNYKEYVGACLTETMVIGLNYRFDFFVGFRNNVQGSMSFDMAIFGSTNCSNLPFGGNSSQIGCPVNTGNYDLLGQITVSGSNEWVNVVIDFEAAKSYEVIVLGPACKANPNYIFDSYFYVDRLALAEIGEFGTPLESITGSICQNDLILAVEDNPLHTYQWYKDGVALPGETNPSISLLPTSDAEGIYSVAIINDEGCSLSKEYHLRIPPYYAPISAEICEGEDYYVGTELISESGDYEIVIPATDGCDSIVQLTMQVNSNSQYDFQDSFCKDELYTFYDISTTSPGLYQTIIPNYLGCDSIINVELSEISSEIGVDIAHTIGIDLGEYLNIIADAYDPDLIQFTWYNENDEVIGEEVNLENFLVFENTTLYLESFDQYGCKIIDTVEVRVDKSNLDLFIPNVFTPDGNNINDHFRFYPTKAVSEIKHFSIYDRWGNMVFQEENINEFENFQGWDGSYRGRHAMSGIYGYYIESEFLDGSVKRFTGDITLLR